MASITHQGNVTVPGTFLLGPAAPASYEQVYQHNRHRVYALAFWMTDNELAAEELMSSTFARAFAQGWEPSPENIDRALIAELWAQNAFEPLSLNEPVCLEVLNVRRNTLRVHLERAIVQLPGTERMIFLMHDVEGYDHTRIARTLEITQEESRLGLHQARLRIRHLVASMPR